VAGADGFEKGAPVHRGRMLRRGITGNPRQTGKSNSNTTVGGRKREGNKWVKQAGERVQKEAGTAGGVAGWVFRESGTPSQREGKRNPQRPAVRPGFTAYEDKDSEDERMGESQCGAV